MNKDEKDILKTYRELTPKNRAAFLDYVKAVYTAQKDGSALPGPPMEGEEWNWQEKD